MTRIAMLSDIHDNIWHLETALRQVAEAEADALLFAGDFCAPFVLSQLAESFAGPIHCVLGNNDGDGRLLQTLAAPFDHLTLHGIYTELSLGACRLSLIHYPAPARRIAQSGEFDLVCYGHNHVRQAEQIGRGWLVNPGEVMGRFGEPTWALYDSESHAVRHIPIPA